jgi:hypothetical protein
MKTYTHNVDHQTVVTHEHEGKRIEYLDIHFSEYPLEKVLYRLEEKLNEIIDLINPELGGKE